MKKKLLAVSLMVLGVLGLAAGASADVLVSSQRFPCRGHWYRQELWYKWVRNPRVNKGKPYKQYYCRTVEIRK